MKPMILLFRAVVIPIAVIPLRCLVRAPKIALELAMIPYPFKIDSLNLLTVMFEFKVAKGIFYFI